MRIKTDTRPKDWLSAYQTSISEVTGVTDRDLLSRIEDSMRFDFGSCPTLDHLSATEFDRLARRAFREIVRETKNA
jgi:hypothetical protein